jgi:hypothetical protein
MSHVKKTMRANKGKPLSAVLKMAAKTYKKTAKVSKKKKNRGMFGMYGGGGVASTAGDVGGSGSNAAIMEQWAVVVEPRKTDLRSIKD